MESSNGYYSLIQLCPDLSRLETVNVGVILFCPARRFIEARVTTSLDRARALFRDRLGGLQRIKHAAAAIEERLKVDRMSFRELADLERFAKARANDLLVTPPRSVKVVKPDEDLMRLYDELVGGRHRGEARRPEIPDLDRVMRQLHEKGRAQLDLEVNVPIVGRLLKVPYAYENGAVNLIKPQPFAADLTQATGMAMRRAVEGNLLIRHSKEALGREHRLVIVTLFEDGGTSPRDVQRRVLDVLREYEVNTVSREDVSSFAERVEREAH